MAAAGDPAVSAAQAAQAAGGHILVVEGAIATGASGKYCTVWPGMTILNAVQAFSQGAGFILAVGSCAAFGGVTAGTPIPRGQRRERCPGGRQPDHQHPWLPRTPRLDRGYGGVSPG